MELDALPIPLLQNIQSLEASKRYGHLKKQVAEMANDAQLVQSCILCFPMACAVLAGRVKPLLRDCAS